MVPGIADRSFNYGDGIFTTIKVSQGQLQLWPLHLQRLQHAAARLAFGHIDWQRLQQQVFAAVTESEQVIKVLVSRGEGGRGYSPKGIVQPLWYITTAPLPDVSQARNSGIVVKCAALKLAIQPLLAGLKHNNRLEQVLLKQELAQHDCDDLLVQDQQGFVTEAISANVFFLKQNQWYTPELNRAGVAGVMRQHILLNSRVTEINWHLDTIDHIDAMFVCNALTGIVPVRQLNGRALTIAPVQQFSRALLC